MSESRLYWLNKDTLEREHRLARKLVEDQGIVISKDAAAYELARAAFAKVAIAEQNFLFPSTLRLVYVYDMDEQPKEHEISNSDGFSGVSEKMEDGKRVSSIGISIQALQKSEEYAALIFLHELAHVVSHGRKHDKLYHVLLDMMIAQYNDHHGTHVVNDYFGL